MDRKSTYFRQLVDEGQLNELFNDVEDALTNLVVDSTSSNGGVLSCPDPIAIQTSPASLVLCVGPVTAYDHVGRRISMLLQEPDVSTDYLGATTTVGLAGNERWLSLFLRSVQAESEPYVDGRGVPGFYRLDESWELILKQAAERVGGTDLKPALSAEDVLLFDAKRVFGKATIEDADLDFSRTQYWEEASVARHRASLTGHSAVQVVDPSSGNPFRGASVNATLGNVVAELLALSGFKDLAARWSIGVLSESDSQPLLLVDSDPTKLILQPFYVLTGSAAAPVILEDGFSSLNLLNPTDNQTSFVIYKPSTRAVRFGNVATPSWPALDEILLGVVKTAVGGNVTWVHDFPQRAVCGSRDVRKTGLRLSSGSSATKIRVSPGRLQQTGREWVSPLIVEFEHSDADFWGGAADVAAGWRYIYAFNDDFTNRVRFRVSTVRPGPDGRPSSLVAGDVVSSCYLGAMYWGGAALSRTVGLGGETRYLARESGCTVLNGGTETAAMTLIDLAGAVPKTATAVDLHVSIFDTDDDPVRFFLGSSSANYDQIDVEGQPSSGTGSAWRQSFVLRVALQEEQACYYKRSLPGAGPGGELSVHVVGWVEDLAHPISYGGGSVLDVLQTLAE